MLVFVLLELVMGVGPMNLVITNDALYLLSYTSARNDHYNEAARALQELFLIRRTRKPGSFLHADDALHLVYAGKRFDLFQRFTHAEFACTMR